MDLDDWPLVLGQTRSAAPDSGVDSLGPKQAPVPEPLSHDSLLGPVVFEPLSVQCWFQRREVSLLRSAIGRPRAGAAEAAWPTAESTTRTSNQHQVKTREAA